MCNKPFIRLVHWLLKEGSRPVVITGGTTEERLKVADEFAVSYQKLEKGNAFIINATNSLAMAQSFYKILQKYNLQEHTNIVEVMAAVCIEFKDKKTLYIFQELELDNSFFALFLCHDNINSDILITNANIPPEFNKYTVVNHHVFKTRGLKSVIKTLDKDLQDIFEKENLISRYTTIEIKNIPEKENITIPMKVFPRNMEKFEMPIEESSNLGREMIRVTEEMKKFKIENKEFINYVKDSYKINTFDLPKRIEHHTDISKKKF